MEAIDQLFEIFTDAAVKLLIALIPIIFAVLSRYLIQLLQAHMAKLEKQGKSTDLKILRQLSEIAVLAAEQIMPSEASGNDKYMYAASQLAHLANEAGIKLTAQQVELLIESSVKELLKPWFAVEELKPEPADGGE